MRAPAARHVQPDDQQNRDHRLACHDGDEKIGFLRHRLARLFEYLGVFCGMCNDSEKMDMHGM
jgi:hypothetical protein